MTSLPVTPGGMSGHLAGKPETLEHGPSETLGHVRLSTYYKGEDKADG